MRKLLTSPAQMSLGQTEHVIYENVLKYVADLALNLMAIKVENRPEDFLSWCKEMHHLCKHKINMDLLEPAQLRPLKKLQETLESGVSVCQLKMLRIAPWPIFVNYIAENSKLQALEERLSLLDYVAELQSKSLAEMIEEDRLTIAGKHGAMHDVSIYTFDVEWFGATKGAKTFIRLLESNPEKFDEALNFIPPTGDVTYEDYQAFVSSYKAIFSELTDNEKAPLMPATRILAMRRPDLFVSLTNNKLSDICQGLNITKFNNQDFESYWQELILAIHSCTWHNQTAPIDELELRLWNVRAILTDLFFFADESLAKGSNYLRMRDKPQKVKIGVSRTIKRSKESAESIVDKALAADEIPEYLLEMRSSLINSVKDGKPVEKAISLMRSIFG